MACHFILLTVSVRVSVEEQTVLIVVKTNLSSCSFMDVIFGVVFKKSLSKPKSQVFSYFFFLKCSIVLGLQFWSINNFGLLTILSSFFYGANYGPIFLSCVWI